MTYLRRILFALVVSLVSLTSWADPIDINTATAEQFASALKGVGPNKAQAIVQYRQNHGPFKTIEDLSLVRGIGEKTIEANREALRVNAESSAGSKKQQ